MLSEQISNIWKTGPFLPTLGPINYVQVAPGIYAQLPDTGLRGARWTVVIVLTAEIE